MKIAFVCCDLNPDMRPCFETLYIWLEQLRQHLEQAQAPPARLLHEIENFQDSYISSEDALSPTSQRSLDNLNEPLETTTTTTTPTTTTSATPAQPDVVVVVPQEEKENVELVENVVMRPHEIPKSPHLGKDFSPSGERLRDSMRARRRQRFLGAQQQHQQQQQEHLQQQRRGLTPETTSTERALKQALKKCRPYGEKGYLVDLRPGAELQLNDVRDLNNYSDVDSSCDTSLNYHEVNATQTTPAATPTPTPPPPAPPSPTPAAAAATSASAAEHARLAFKDMRQRLHQCRSKFEHLEEASRRNFSQSQHSMRNFFKTPPVALKMFQRLEHEASLEANGNGVGGATPARRNVVVTTQRINQTPIFGRRQLPVSLSPQLQHAESLEHLATMPATQTAQAAPKRSKATPTAATSTSAAPTTVVSTGNASASASVLDYLPKKHKMTLPLQRASNQSRQLANSGKSRQQKSTTTTTNSSSATNGNGSNCVSPTRHRPGSPGKQHLAQRHTAATAQRQNHNGKQRPNRKREKKTERERRREDAAEKERARQVE